jgi:hypothetical protein
LVFLRLGELEKDETYSIPVGWFLLTYSVIEKGEKKFNL